MRILWFFFFSIRYRNYIGRERLFPPILPKGKLYVEINCFNSYLLGYFHPLPLKKKKRPTLGEKNDYVSKRANSEYLNTYYLRIIIIVEFVKYAFKNIFFKYKRNS